jgi:hypothetical protein
MPWQFYFKSLTRCVVSKEVWKHRIVIMVSVFYRYTIYGVLKSKKDLVDFNKHNVVIIQYYPG